MALSLCPRETDESMAGSVPSGPDHPRDAEYERPKTDFPT